MNDQATKAKIGVGVGVLLLLSYKAITSYLRKRRIESLLESVRQKKTVQFQNELAKSGLEGVGPQTLTREEQKIVYAAASELIEWIRAGRVTCEEVVTTFCRQAVRVHHDHNCLTEFFAAEAIERARVFDRRRADSQDIKSLPPLFGIPISLKDTVPVAGYDSTVGAVTFADQPAEADCLLVRLLRSAGAIPFTKTNVPQTMLSFECRNPLFGRTTNPWNRDFTPGGSSGGESCLIVAKGTPFGIGTDVGGSLRIPAHFAGCFGFKPTARLVTKQGFRSGVPGQEAIPSVCGPMGSNVNDLVLLMKTLLTEEAWLNDPDLVPMPFDEKEYRNNGKLRVGYYVDDGFVPATPACARGVTDAVEALRRAGHIIVEFTPPGVVEIMPLFFALLGADGMTTVLKSLEKDIYEDYVSSMLVKMKLPGFMKRLIAFAVRNFKGDAKAAQMVLNFREYNVAEYWKLIVQRNICRKNFFEAWRKQELDVVICPAHALPAVPHMSFNDITFACCYTALYNVLDYPAGVVPVTRVEQSDTIPHRPKDLLQSSVYKHYNPAKQAGLPIGVQVAGLPFRDATVLRAMRILSEELPFYELPPCKSLGSRS